MALDEEAKQVLIVSTDLIEEITAVQSLVVYGDLGIETVDLLRLAALLANTIMQYTLAKGAK